jgi:hypothetical protein
MMLFKSKEYPHGKYQVLWLQGNFFKRFHIGKGIGFWKHPRIPLGCYADWSLRLAFIEIKKWLSDKELHEF